MADRMPPVEHARDLRMQRVAAFHAATDAAFGRRVDFDDLALKWIAARDLWLDAASRALPPHDLYPQIEAASREQQALESLAAAQPSSALRRLGKEMRALRRAIAESPVGRALARMVDWLARRQT